MPLTLPTTKPASVQDQKALALGGGRRVTRSCQCHSSSLTAAHVPSVHSATGSVKINTSPAVWGHCRLGQAQAGASVTFCGAPQANLVRSPQHQSMTAATGSIATSLPG